MPTKISLCALYQVFSAYFPELFLLALLCSNEICDESKNFTMCPLCDYQCPYWKLSAACSHARASRIFDNNATVFFAIFMSFWGERFHYAPFLILQRITEYC